MINFKLAPYEVDEVLTGEQIACKLQVLIGSKFQLTNKPRTNGSHLRKLIESILDDGNIKVANREDYIVIPDKNKGVPRLLACLSDSFLVTTGDSYNLQVWNRIPHSDNELIRYKTGKSIKCKDILFILAKVNPIEQVITSIVVATPKYINEKFGIFGVPTIKYQMLISNQKRLEIINNPNSCCILSDTQKVRRLISSNSYCCIGKMGDAPTSESILSIKDIKDKIVNELLGTKIEGNDTKTKGQYLERKIAKLLGYDVDSHLVGVYPDIPNQILEIKVQDSPTVDLGKYSPLNSVKLEGILNLTTQDVRYLIALTDKYGKVEGVILSSGKNLRREFRFVNGTNYKCQRSIPMSFFNEYEGRSVFNP